MRRFSSHLWLLGRQCAAQLSNPLFTTHKRRPVLRGMFRISPILSIEADPFTSTMAQRSNASQQVRGRA